MYKTDDEVERMTLCIAQMAATLAAASYELEYRENAPMDNEYFVRRARTLYDLADANVAHEHPNTVEVGPGEGANG